MFIETTHTNLIVLPVEAHCVCSLMQFHPSLNISGPQIFFNIRTGTTSVQRFQSSYFISEQPSMLSFLSIAVQQFWTIFLKDLRAPPLKKKKNHTLSRRVGFFLRIGLINSNIHANVSELPLCFTASHAFPFIPRKQTGFTKQAFKDVGPEAHGSSPTHSPSTSTL